MDHFEYAVNKMGGIIEILTSSKQKETNQNSQEESFSYLKYYYESVHMDGNTKLWFSLFHSSPNNNEHSLGFLLGSFISLCLPPGQNKEAIFPFSNKPFIFTW